jgi:glycosyltransferase involved in cell wall biosynthesis
MIEEKASEDKRIKIIGFVEGKILRELYSNARLFVFPSEAEGMPMCLLEAMSYDCPCLVSNIPENLEVGGDFVKSFETSNVEDLKNKLEECLADKTIMNSRNYIQEKYSWDNVVDSTLSVYSSIIK